MIAIIALSSLSHLSFNRTTGFQVFVVELSSSNIVRKKNV